MALNSYRTPVTLPAVVTHYYEPSPRNGLVLVGDNKASHQIFVAHQVRLLNTLIGFVSGLPQKNTHEIACQNRFLVYEDLDHLLKIIEKLELAELIDPAKRPLMEEELVEVFTKIFPNQNVNPVMKIVASSSRLLAVSTRAPDSRRAE